MMAGETNFTAHRVVTVWLNRYAMHQNPLFPVYVSQFGSVPEIERAKAKCYTKRMTNKEINMAATWANLCFNKRNMFY